MQAKEGAIMKQFAKIVKSALLFGAASFSLAAAAQAPAQDAPVQAVKPRAGANAAPARQPCGEN